MKVIRNGYKLTQYVKAFDLDGTLVETASGKRFPEDDIDFSLLPLAKELQLVNEPIVIFTNQTYKKNKDRYIQRIRNIIEEMNIPCDVYISLDKDTKKPKTEMLEEFLKWYGVDFERFLYVGDAAGRDGDYSDSDRAFAHNANVLFKFRDLDIKVRFQTPEKYSNLNKDIESDLQLDHAKVMKWKGFDPIVYLNNLGDIAQRQTEIMESLIKQPQTLIITVGPPGSGKTLFAHRLKDLNPDLTIVDEQVRKKEMKLIREAPGPIIVSRTSPSEERRQEYIDVHPDWEHIIVYWDDIEVAKHSNEVRSKMGKKHIPNIVYNLYLKKLEVPDEYIPWKFDGTFTTTEEMYYFMMRF